MKNTLSQETIDGFNRLNRGFLKPDLYHGAVTFDLFDGPMPSEEWLANHCPCDDAERIEDESVGWLCRLSAPGYLDCTEWGGPFETEESAVEAIVELYGDEDAQA
jgi:hypothetical protein